MEDVVEHIRVNLNKELWRIDYAAGIAKHLGGDLTINNNNNSVGNLDSNNTKNKTSNLEGVAGYNGDITQYLQDKGYIWEQIDEGSIKFRHQNDPNDN
jgi:hypothetical protein